MPYKSVCVRVYIYYIFLIFGTYIFIYKYIYKYIYIYI